MPTTSVSDAVFSVSEILELIFLALPARNLFTIQAVSKAWKSMITTSLRIRRAMFLAPDGDVLQTEIAESFWVRNGNAEEMPLLRSCAAIEYAPIFDTSPSPWDRFYPCVEPLDVRGWISTTWEKGHTHGEEIVEIRAMQWPVLAMPFSVAIDSNWFIPRVDPRMYVTQPPVDRLSVYVSLREKGWKTFETPYRSRGVTVGDISDVLEDVLARNLEAPEPGLTRLHTYIGFTE